MKCDWIIITRAKQSIESFPESISYMLVGTLLLSLKQTSISLDVTSAVAVGSEKRSHGQGRAGQECDQIECHLAGDRGRTYLIPLTV